ncbi:putative peptidase C14 [Colletotrichum sublineola]|uniref:Putative peptidase C14 n=1 Tax=Colletotrichum sublineola TaxID=1173701 RepID=A0A066XKR2_COLSU|nr:putative peptidase C14 [Colletotrichum sublineola]
MAFFGILVSMIPGAFWAVIVAAVIFALYPVAIKVQHRRQDSHRNGIEVIYDPPNASFEIVAVHGLGAHPKHTWEGKPAGLDHEKLHLLRNLLPCDFPTARILSFAYNSDWLVDAPEKTAEQVGEGLLNGLVVHRGKEKPRLPIIFIGHSFGGIVIKQVRPLRCVMLSSI